MPAKPRRSVRRTAESAPIAALCDAYLAELRPHLGVFTLRALPVGWFTDDTNVPAKAHFPALMDALNAAGGTVDHPYGQITIRLTVHGESLHVEVVETL